MRNVRSVALVLLLAVGFTWGILRLLGNQFAAGGFYPQYSTLRSDAKGAKLLYDSLSRLPGMTISRNYLPLEYFTGKAAVVVLGLTPASLDADFVKRAEGIARGGGRLVAALDFQGEAPAEDASPKKTALEEAWHVKLVIDPNARHPHRLSFAPGPEWTNLEKNRDYKGAELSNESLAIERPFGPGTVLLLADSSDFANESTIAGDRLDRVSAALGNYTRVAFDEQHFGIAESGSVVQLARRFRLMGLALGLVIVGGLAIWKNAAAFPPPLITGSPAPHVGRTSFEGLVTLLRHHVRPRDLVQTCWAEWLKANRREIAADRVSRAAAIAAQAAGDPLAAIHEIQAGLAWPPAGRAKGEL